MTTLWFQKARRFRAPRFFRVQQLLDLLLCKGHPAAQGPGIQVDLGGELQGLHPPVGGFQVLLQGDRPVVGQQHGTVALPDQGSQMVGQRLGARAAVLGHRHHRAQHHDALPQNRVVDGLAGAGESSGRWRVGMAHTAHIGPLPVDAQVHLGLGGRLIARRGLQQAAVQVTYQQHLRGQVSLAHPGGGDQDVPVGKPHGQVAVVGGHPAPLPQLVAVFAHQRALCLIGHISPVPSVFPKYRRGVPPAHGSYYRGFALPFQSPGEKNRGKGRKRAGRKVPPGRFGSGVFTSWARGSPGRRCRTPSWRRQPDRPGPGSRWG